MENPQKPGIKLLLSMKSNIEDGEELDIDEEVNNENYVEEITDEEFNKQAREMDDLIFDIIRTKQKLRLGKLKSKIKTREDLLNFMNIRDNDDCRLPPEPCNGNSQILLDKMKINKDSKSNNEF